MPKELSDEERQAVGARLKAARQAKQQKKEADQEVAEATQPNQIGAIIAAVLEKMEERQGSNRRSGRTIEVYPVDKAHYPDPTERLYDVPELRRFALRDNYRVYWDVKLSTYQTADGQWYREPRFETELWRFPKEHELLEAEEKGLKQITPQTEIFIGRQLQSEDDVVTKKIAEEMGLKVGRDFESFDQLMDEIRFEIIKRWLLSLPEFGGGRPSQKTDTGAETALGGRVVKIHNKGRADEMVESEKIIR